jgi:hypothetical protein
MPKERRERRLAELRALRQSDPVALLAIYQEGADLDQLARQAGGVTFAAMIAAILDREENQPAERR